MKQDQVSNIHCRTHAGIKTCVPKCIKACMPSLCAYVCVCVRAWVVCMCACFAAVPWNPRPVSAPLQQTQRLVVPSMSLHHAGRRWRMPNMGSPRPADLQVQISSVLGLSTHWDGVTHTFTRWMDGHTVRRYSTLYSTMNFCF